jgi:hypothetical protein
VKDERRSSRGATFVRRRRKKRRPRLAVALIALRPRYYISVSATRCNGRTRRRLGDRQRIERIVKRSEQKYTFVAALSKTSYPVYPLPNLSYPLNRVPCDSGVDGARPAAASHRPAALCKAGIRPCLRRCRCGDYSTPPAGAQSVARPIPGAEYRGWRIEDRTLHATLAILYPRSSTLYLLSPTCEMCYNFYTVWRQAVCSKGDRP